MIHHYELKAREVHNYTVQVLKKHLKIEANGSCCHTDMILDILIKASAEGSRVEAVYADLEETADSNTIREYLNQSLVVKEIHQQEERANTSLAGGNDPASICNCRVHHLFPP